MNENLTRDDLDLILESLTYGKDKLASYPHHLDAEFKRQQVTRIERLIEKVRSLRTQVTV